MDKQNDEYILTESPEIATGQYPNWTQKITRSFPALAHRNYQFYFVGQLTSLIGTWMQIVAQGWLVLQLTHSAFWVGAVTALGALPVLLFGLFAGVIVDRFPKKTLMLATQVCAGLLSLILGLLTILGMVNVYEVAVLSFLLGVVMALDLPTRQAFAVELVGKEDLSSAIALNAGIFNGARVIGPAIAGLTIAVVGTGGAFLINAASYIAVIIALRYMKVTEKIQEVHSHPIKAIKEGLSYAFSHPVIKTLLIFSAITSIFGWTYTTILPVIVERTFHQGAATLGYLQAIAGFGALLGTVIVSGYSKKIPYMTFIVGGSLMFGVSLFLFTFTNSVLFAAPFLFLSGLGLIMQYATMNSTIQHAVADNMRGRVMSIYTLMFLGMTPIGSFQIGYLAEHFGSAFAIQVGALVILVCGIYLLIQRKTLASLHTD